MFPRIIQFLALMLCMNKFITGYEVRMAMMFPFGHGYLKRLSGYETSASAVTIALDRVKDENLLPGANFSFIFRDFQCREDQVAGYIIDILSNNLADVIVGSPCAAATSIASVLCAKYNVPILNWAISSMETADNKRLDTSSKTIASASRIGRGLVELLHYFSWHRVVILFTDDGSAKKCHSIGQGTMKYLASTGIHNAFSLILDHMEPTDSEIEWFLEEMKQNARIAIICVDHGINRVMLKAQEKGMMTDDYVYILPEYVHSHNHTELWTNYNPMNVRYAEAKLAFKNVLFIEMELSSEDALHSFKKRIPEKMRMTPFYHFEQKGDEFYGSLYSPFLHDSVYLYALTLNKTLSKGGNISDGRAITKYSKDVKFQGVSGFVTMDETGTRDAIFIVKTLDKYDRLWPIAKLKTLRYRVAGDTENESWTEVDAVEMLVPEMLVWESRGGYKPTSQPRCGWLNDHCVEETESIGTIISLITIGAVLFVIIVSTMIAYLIRKRLIVSELSQMRWRVNFKDLIPMKEYQERSQTSYNTMNAGVSDETAEAILKGLEQVASYKGTLVWMRIHHGSFIISSKSDHMELKMLRDMSHDNLNTFVGLCIDTLKPISLWSYCAKGSLEDVLQITTVKLDWFFKYSLIKDLATGLEHLHNSGVCSHGHLKSSNCLVDPRWVLKITDYGLASFRAAHEVSVKDRIWTAPELLRLEDLPPKGTQKGDIYSLAIIVSEIITRDKPFSMLEDMSPEEIVAKVRRGDPPVLRPMVRNIIETDTDPHIISLMNDCWMEAPERRPDLKEIRGAIRQMGKGKNTGLMDHVLKLMETHAKNLETVVNERTRQLTEEMKKSDLLLYKMLPPMIAERLKRAENVDPEAFEAATLFFSDVADFQSIAARCTPIQLITFINELYTTLDAIIEKYDVYKVETVNNCYLVVSGLPKRNGNKHACEIADMALHLQLSMQTFTVSSLPNDRFELRCGIHTGPVVAGVVGQIMSRYCLFGDTVNTASRVETNSKPSCIHISDATQKYLTQIIGGYITKPRGEIVLKGKGIMSTYWLLGKKVRTILDKTEATNVEATPVIEIRDVNQ